MPREREQEMGINIRGCKCGRILDTLFLFSREYFRRAEERFDRIVSGEKEYWNLIKAM